MNYFTKRFIYLQSYLRVERFADAREEVEGPQRLVRQNGRHAGSIGAGVVDENGDVAVSDNEDAVVEFLLQRTDPDFHFLLDRLIDTNCTELVHPSAVSGFQWGVDFHLSSRTVHLQPD